MTMHEQVPTPTNANEWLNVAEAAAAARTGRSRIRAAVRSGALRALEINGRGELRIARTWLAAWLEQLEASREQLATQRRERIAAIRAGRQEGAPSIA
jgi:excisionase family DNA binding protein